MSNSKRSIPVNWAGFGRSLKQYSMLIAFGVIAVLLYVMTDGKLLYPMNVSNIVFQNAYVVVLAVGMLICILTGGNIDLSVGSVVALVSACAGTFIISWKWNPYLSMLLCLGIGALVGVWQGFWIAYIRIPAFIVTLAGMMVFRGLALIILNGLTLAPFPQAFLQFSTGYISNIGEGIVLFGNTLNLTSIIVGVLAAVIYCAMTITGVRNKRKKGYDVQKTWVIAVKLICVSAVLIWFFYILSRYRGIPTVLTILGVLLLLYGYATKNTVIGRHIYALGGNEKAARLSGVKTQELLFLAYVNMGFLAGVAGLVFGARLNAASPQAGLNFELDAIAACYIGGASAYGGIGTVGGTLIGALIMGILNNGMSIMGIDSNRQMVVKGLVLLVAVAFDVISKQHIELPKFLFLSGRRKRAASAKQLM